MSNKKLSFSERLDHLYWILYKDCNDDDLTGFEKKLLKFIYPIASWSLKHANKQQHLDDLIGTLEKIVPNIKHQMTHYKFLDVAERKERALQAFQCQMMREIFNTASFQNKSQLTLVDIGDSAGTHTQYVQSLFGSHFQSLDIVSINLDQKAIEKIRSKGLNAKLARAETFELDAPIDLFMSFQMLEHLHDPVLFLRRLAKKGKADYLFITVPYFKHSRVGLHSIRTESKQPVSAEETHIFELSPKDWTLLFLHAGWQPMISRVHYNYPKNWPLISPLLGHFWKIIDFEGYWGCLLVRYLEISDRYQDWNE